LFGLLELLARHFGADPACFLTEIKCALDLREAIGRGYYPPRGSVTAPSRAVAEAAEVIEAGARHFLALGNADHRTSGLAADLGMPVDEVGAGSQAAGSWPQDEITSGEAAGLLGVCAERVRQLLAAGALEGWQDSTGRREWHVSRASVTAYRERSGGDGSGSARRSA
jgi:hypothetical protein